MLHARNGVSCGLGLALFLMAGAQPASQSARLTVTPANALLEDRLPLPIQLLNSFQGGHRGSPCVR